jgi:hypothetical protein
MGERTVNSSDNHILASFKGISFAQLPRSPRNIAPLASSFARNVGWVKCEVDRPELLDKLGDERHSLEINVLLPLLHAQIDLHIRGLVA